MKTVLLSADNQPSVYLVPDEVADNLFEFCANHFYNWLEHSTEAEKYRWSDGYCFDETAFIGFLNITFPNEKCVLIETLEGIQTKKDIPAKYKDCVRFNF